MLLILVSLTFGNWVLATTVVRDICAQNVPSATLPVKHVEGVATSATCARMEKSGIRMLNRSWRIVR